MESLNRFKLAASAMGNAMRDLPGLFQSPNPDQEEGERLLALGEYAQAEALLTRAAWELKARSAAAHRQANALVSLGTAQWKCKKLTEAKQTAAAARELASSRRKPISELAAALDLTGSILLEEGDFAGAISALREALEAQARVVPVEAQALVTRHRNLAAALHESGKIEEAEALLNRALECAETKLGSRSPAMADCLMDLGECQLAREHFEAAISSMEKAVEIHRESLGGSSEEVARDLQVLAAVCHKTGDLDKAVKYYEQALYIRERQLGGNAEEFADLLMGLAGAHTLMGNDAGAMEMLQQAVAKLESTGGTRFASAIESLGEAYSRWGRYDDAVSCYRKARNVWEKDPDTHYASIEANQALLEAVMTYVTPEAGDSGALIDAIQSLQGEGWASQSPEPHPAAEVPAGFPGIKSSPATAGASITVPASLAAMLRGAPAVPGSASASGGVAPTGGIPFAGGGPPTGGSYPVASPSVARPKPPITSACWDELCFDYLAMS